ASVEVAGRPRHLAPADLDVARREEAGDAAEARKTSRDTLAYPPGEARQVGVARASDKDLPGQHASTHEYLAAAGHPARQRDAFAPAIGEIGGLIETLPAPYQHTRRIAMEPDQVGRQTMPVPLDKRRGHGDVPARRVEARIDDANGQCHASA